jgi:phi LC3 family holin
MKINWLVRIKNKTFWFAMIPLIVVLIQLIASIFGATIDLGEIGNKVLAIIDVVFAILGLLGVVVDPTTKGISDSENAMSYDKPKEYDDDI